MDALLLFFVRIGIILTLIWVFFARVLLWLHRLKEDLIRKAQLHGLFGIHPGLIFHELCNAAVGKPGLKGIGVDDALLDLVEGADGFLHVPGVTHGNGAGIMDHQHGYGRHEDFVPGHGDHRGS